MNKYFQTILFIIVIMLLFAIILYINKNNISQTLTMNTSEKIEYTTMLTISKKENTSQTIHMHKYNITIIDFKVNIENIYFNNETNFYSITLSWIIYVKSNTNYTYPVSFYEYETAEGEGALTTIIEEEVYPNKITKIESEIHRVSFKGSEEELYFGMKTFKIIIAYPPPYEPGKGKARLIFYNLSGKFWVYIP